MTNQEYRELQNYLSSLLKNNPYSSSWKTEEAYEKAILQVKSKIKEIYNKNNFKIGDRILVTNKLDGYGTIVTEPKIVLKTVHYGIKFDNPSMNDLYNPYYIAEELLVKIDEHNKI